MGMRFLFVSVIPYQKIKAKVGVRLMLGSNENKREYGKR